MTTTINHLTAKQTIQRLHKALVLRNPHQIINIYSPDEPEEMPDWEQEPEYIQEEWQRLRHRAEVVLGLN